jgi:hypothetical protein
MPCLNGMGAAKGDDPLVAGAFALRRAAMPMPTAR